ncbi:hypothetical protein e2017b09.tmp0061 [Eimeria tenella]|uniref:Uncharacterized protein n=1 Tax=Eimeria tenella TaxID=5802 RepID=C8TDV4_EIMTE|nr:hypothetical protein e2017b09.tmp0061 [Eimeria tenella]
MLTVLKALTPKYETLILVTVLPQQDHEIFTVRSTPLSRPSDPYQPQARRGTFNPKDDNNIIIAKVLLAMPLDRVRHKQHLTSTSLGQLDAPYVDDFHEIIEGHSLCLPCGEMLLAIDSLLAAKIVQNVGPIPNCVAFQLRHARPLLSSCELWRATHSNVKKKYLNGKAQDPGEFPASCTAL